MLAKKVRDDMVAAMKAKDDVRVQCLRMALAAFTNELVAKGKKPTEELADNDAVTVFKRLAKQRKEAAEQYAKGGRVDLAEKESKELKIVEEYLPQMASEEEIEKVAKEKIAEMKADRTKMGHVMGTVMKTLSGNADGALVKKVVERLFGA